KCGETFKTLTTENTELDGGFHRGVSCKILWWVRRDYNNFMLPRMTIRVKGTTGLLIAAAFIVLLVVYPTAYRPFFRAFFFISVGLGIVIAAILYLRNKYLPVKEKDVENKRPLGLE